MANDSARIERPAPVASGSSDPASGSPDPASGSPDPASGSPDPASGPADPASGPADPAGGPAGRPADGPSGRRQPDLRSRARRALQAEITAVAFDLFDRQGFECTTTGQIAAAAGLSRSSFFRYFATKEDVVLGGLEERGLLLRDALVDRPDDEPPWPALRHALVSIIRRNADNPDRALRLSRMMVETPSLRGRQAERQRSWQALLVPEVARRLGVPPGSTTDPRPRALVSAAIGCYDAMLEAWRESDGTADREVLLDRAMSVLSG